MADTGIPSLVINEIRNLASLYGVTSVTLFGSRARGDHALKSDIDLAVVGGDFAAFAADTDEHTSTLLKFDFVNMDALISDELRTRIEEEGMVLYEEA